MSDDKTVLPDGLDARRDAIIKIIMESAAYESWGVKNWKQVAAERILTAVLCVEKPMVERVERLEKAVRFLSVQVNASFIGGMPVLVAKEVESILNDKTVG